MRKNLNSNIDDKEIQILGGSVYHTEAWRKLISHTFGYESNYICSFDNGKLNGLIPAFVVDSFFQSPHITISPFSHYVEPLSRDDDVLKNLIGQLKELCNQEGCKYIEFHGGGDSLAKFGFEVSEQNWISYLDLNQSNSDLLDGFRSSTRRNIKKAERSGLVVEQRTALSDYYDFSDLVLETRQYQGSLPYPEQLYEELHENPY